MNIRCVALIAINIREKQSSPNTINSCIRIRVVISMETLHTLLKKLFALLIVSVAFTAKASSQQVDSIYFNLYTDSLKKGSLHYNYINVDGKLNDGSWLPLDSTQVILTASTGKITGNVLMLDSAEKAIFVLITATLRSNPLVRKEVKIYIKKVLNDELLKSEEELIEGWQKPNRRKN